VHPDYRRQGVFQALHGQIESEARALPDVIGLRLYVEDANERAQHTYRAMGLKPGGYHVYEVIWNDRFRDL
jgi:ribosomal protein S18 acetylase RimI-like enzyme